MALFTDAQRQALNDLYLSEPGLKKGQFTADIKLGDLLETTLIAEIATADATAAVVANADATYGQPEADLINELKTNFNAAVTLLNEIKDAINAAAK